MNPKFSEGNKVIYCGTIKTLHGEQRVVIEGGVIDWHSPQEPETDHIADALVGVKLESKDQNLPYEYVDLGNGLGGMRRVEPATQDIDQAIPERKTAPYLPVEVHQTAENKVFWTPEPKPQHTYRCPCKHDCEFTGTKAKVISHVWDDHREKAPQAHLDIWERYFKVSEV